jgi:hypothetical protein
VRRQVRHQERGDGAPTQDVDVVVHDQGAVGAAANVEFDTIGAEATGLAEGINGVFPGNPAGAPMGEDHDHGVGFSQIFLTNPLPRAASSP